MNLLKTKDIAEMLDVHRSIVVRWCDNGVGPRFIRTPRGHYRFEPQAVDEWLQKLRSDQTQPDVGATAPENMSTREAS